MSELIERRTIVDELLTVLRDVLPWQVGDGATPFDEDEDDKFPFLILYSIPGGGYIGSLNDGHEEAEIVVQVTASGRRRDQADLALDRARGAILGKTEAGVYTNDIQDSTGQRVIKRESDGGPGGIDASGRPPHRLFTATERFKLTVSP